MTMPPSPFCDLGPAEPQPEAAPAPSVPESFSELAARRSMPIVSPPLRDRKPRQVLVDLDALEEAIVPRPQRPLPDCIGSIDDVAASLPRDMADPPPPVDDEPAPLFLRNPSQAFIRALLEIAGER